MEDSPRIPSIVKLNVGGHHFTASVQTLTKDPKSMLAAMFSGKFEMKPYEDDAFFIDRDGTHFRFILNYLRTGKLTLPEGATFLKELQEEAEFYQIQGMLMELKSLTSTSTTPSTSTTVKLNVGGEFFTTDRQTLTRDPSSVLAAMFSTGPHRDPFFDPMDYGVKPQPSDDGSFFIDRDGKHFRIVLNYLRNKELILPEDASDTFLKELEAEAKFYKIRGMRNELEEILENRRRKARAKFF
ncbi:uncharacterized protein DDB_G0287347-like [Orbicella faveolata]|uniref:uncharacterized protein DDB_G0287347-like n=1 Tax=Orbicella faveolata TaxID=48498 RepID=UPI0009E43BFE|nr:uncharacterized protein DDB_G0287347-like [Orbicella faveolata]